MTAPDLLKSDPCFRAAHISCQAPAACRCACHGHAETPIGRPPGRPARRHCDACDRDRPVNKDGSLMTHRTAHGTTCPGSGRTQPEETTAP